MGLLLFTATGCRRCGIVRSALGDWGYTWEEMDIKAGGKEAFNTFYRENRSRIIRTEDGVEFPILFNGQDIFQGPGVILAWLRACEPLLAFVGENHLTHDWIGGFTLAADDPAGVSRYLPEVLARLRQGGLKLELASYGHLPGLLAVIEEKKLVDRLIVYLNPASSMAAPGGLPEPGELEKTISLAPLMTEYRFELILEPVLSATGLTFPLVEDAVKMAALVEKVTGSKKHPFLIRAVNPGEGLQLAPLTMADLFRYRTGCRRHMVAAEIAHS